MTKLPRRVSKPGPVLDYLSAMIGGPAANDESRIIADQVIKAVRRVFNSEDGAILMELLDKSTTDYFMDPLSDARACDALNAQRFIALDLRRIVSDEIQHVLAKAEPQRTGSAGRIAGRRAD